MAVEQITEPVYVLTCDRCAETVTYSGSRPQTWSAITLELGRKWLDLCGYCTPALAHFLDAARHAAPGA